MSAEKSSPASSKRKGKSFEDKIVDDVRELLYLDKYRCYRAGSSGSRTSIELTGDVSFTDPLKYRIIIECKYRKTLSLDDFFPVCSAEVCSWIEQNLEQKKRYINEFNVEPLSVIIASRPYMRNHYVIVENQGLDPTCYSIEQYMIFYNERLKRSFLMIAFRDIKKLLCKYVFD
jgi:hypothetical protein